MKRTRAESICAVCKRTPIEDSSGRLACACGTLWRRKKGEAGSPEERRLLETKGFRLEGDEGDLYYHLPQGGHFIHLYPDGTWESDKAAAGQSLEEYLGWIDELLPRADRL